MQHEPVRGIDPNGGLKVLREVWIRMVGLVGGCASATMVPVSLGILPLSLLARARAT